MPAAFSGIGVSAGTALGPAWLPPATAVPVIARRDDAGERARLAAAMAEADRDLAALSADCTAEEAAILAFQSELLADPDLVCDVEAHIGGGADAPSAWRGALDALLAALDDGTDALFAARAADIGDLSIRVLSRLAGAEEAAFPAGSIFVSDEMRPSTFLAHDWSKGGGIVLFSGSATSHVAMLARSRAIPMVIATGVLPVGAGVTLLIDGVRGGVTVDPLPLALPASAVPSDAAVTPDDGRLSTANGTGIDLFANINSLDDLVAFEPATVAGIGLVRSEFLLSGHSLDEDRQAGLYARVLDRAAGKPVAIRMLDVGGDKALPGQPSGGDLHRGLRGIAFLLARPDIARPQVRALLKAGTSGNLRVLLPMVAVPGDVARMIALFEAEALALARPLPPIGMMVEVPAAARMLDRFDNAAFFSLGTNDLARTLTGTAGRPPATAPHALFPLIRLAVGHAHAIGRPISVCGDMAGDPAMLERLLACGLRHFSVAPVRLNAVRSALRRIGTGAAGAGTR